MKKFLALIVVTFTLLACNSTPTSNSKEAQQVSSQQDLFTKNQPVHAYQYSAERAALIQLYDLRVKGDLNTWTVVVSNSGVPLFSCPSKGFPLPYASELTNPQQVDARRVDLGAGYNTIDGVTSQMDPNGIYPGNGLGTWVLCIDDKGVVHPQYFEPLVMTFTYPVAIKDGKIVVTGAADPSSTITK